MQTPVGVFLGDGDDQAQVGLDHFLLGKAAGGFALVHAFVDVFQLVQRHDHELLQVDELLLQVLDGRNVAAHDGAPGLVGARLLFTPAQVEQVRWHAFAVFAPAGEFGNELLLRVAALVHDDAAQIALMAAHGVYLAAQHVAELFNGFGREADGHQLGRERFLRLDVGGRAPAVFAVRREHFFIKLGNAVKALQRLRFQRFQQLGHGLGAALAVVVIVVVFVEVFFGHVVVVFVVVHKAVHDGVDDGFAFTDFGGHLQDFGNDGRAGADGLHHVHQTPFDALGNFNFAFAREQLDRAHLAHVHAHGVGGAAKLAVHGGKGGFGFFLGFFFRGGVVALVGEQQGFGVGRLLIDGHAQIVEHGHHGFQRFRIDQLVRQVVVDFAVSEVAARLAQLEQRLEVGAAQVQLFFGQNGFVQPEFLHQRALLGLADLHAQRLGLLGCCGCAASGFGLRLALQVVFDIRQIGVVILRTCFFAFGWAATLAARFGGFRFSSRLGCGLGGSLGFFGLGRAFRHCVSSFANRFISGSLGDAGFFGLGFWRGFGFFSFGLRGLCSRGFL